MKSKKLDILVEEVKKEYKKAESDFFHASLCSVDSDLLRRDARKETCKLIIDKINEIYQTNYEVYK